MKLQPGTRALSIDVVTGIERAFTHVSTDVRTGVTVVTKSKRSTAYSQQAVTSLCASAVVASAAMAAPSLLAAAVPPRTRCSHRGCCRRSSARSGDSGSGVAGLAS